MSYCPPWYPRESPRIQDLLKWFVDKPEKPTRSESNEPVYIDAATEANIEARNIEAWIREIQTDFDKRAGPSLRSVLSFYQFEESPELECLLEDRKILDTLLQAQDELALQFPVSDVHLRLRHDPDSGEPELLIQPFFKGSADEAMPKYLPLYDLVPHWTPEARRLITFAVEYI